MQTADGLTELHEELQEIARRLHPAILSKGGLAPAVRMLAARTGMAVAVSVQDEARLPEHLKVAAYHVVAEALENVVDHARATSADVWVHTDDAALLVRVRDDGIGGADQRSGSGLVALIDRIDALDGAIEITSPPGGGTTLSISLPLRAAGPPCP